MALPSPGTQKSTAARHLHCPTWLRLPAFSLNSLNGRSCPKLPCFYLLACFVMFSQLAIRQSLFLPAASRFPGVRPHPLSLPLSAWPGSLHSEHKARRIQTPQTPGVNIPSSYLLLSGQRQLCPRTFASRLLSCCPSLGPSRAPHRCHRLKRRSVLGICLLCRRLWVPSPAKSTYDTSLFQENPGRERVRTQTPQRL